MSEVVNVQWVTVAGNDTPEWVEVTLADGRRIRYYKDG